MAWRAVASESAMYELLNLKFRARCSERSTRLSSNEPPRGKCGFHGLISRLGKSGCPWIGVDLPGTKKDAEASIFKDLQASMELCKSIFGAGNETCTRTVSRCFPNTFFVGLASEDLNCSLVFRPRQQIRPKSSTDVQRAALSTPDPRSVHRRRQLPRTHHPRPVACPASITAKTIRQMVLVMAQVGCHLVTPAPQLTGALLVKLL